MRFTSPARTHLYIDAPTLFEALEQVFADVEAELRRDGTLRDRFLTQDRKGRTSDVPVSQASAWRDAVRRAGVLTGELAYSSASGSIVLPAEGSS